jgi:serine/threonine protein phosphatase 1
VKRRFIVGDIHGCSRTFQALCEEELRVTAEDHLYLLGDLVSKGPDSIGVLSYIEDLTDWGVGVTIIRGNHEEAILRAMKAGKNALRQMLERTNNSALLDRKQGKRLDPRWEELLERSQYVVMLPEAILVHGGVDMSQDNPFANGPELTSRRETVYKKKSAQGRMVIHGHSRTGLSTITERLVTGHPVLPLDNGAVGASDRKPFKISEYGNLCCLEVDTKILHVQPNRDVSQAPETQPSFSVRIRAYSQSPTVL